MTTSPCDYAGIKTTAKLAGKGGDERRPAKGGPYAIANDLAIAAKNAAAKLRLGCMRGGRGVAHVRSNSDVIPEIAKRLSGTVKK